MQSHGKLTRIVSEGLWQALLALRVSTPDLHETHIGELKVMKRLVSVCLLGVALIAAAGRAEIVPQSPDELDKNATHIVVGTVRFIGSAERRDKDWLKSGGVVEIKVSEVEKGKRIEVGDCVYPRFWTQAWIGKGDPPPYGSGHHLPSVGDRARVFLKQNDGGYDALLPNGFEVIAKPVTGASPAVQPTATEAPTTAR